jgi:LuxR family transcriptional regulator, maltose regulon positive regulatory protein
MGWRDGVVPLDEVRGWWRYHHLFADLLRMRLHQERPERVVALHRAAAAWAEGQGLADDAVRHALGAADATWAARLIERHADATLLSGERATVQRWLSMLPDDLVWSPAVPGAGVDGAGQQRYVCGRGLRQCRRTPVHRRCQ